MSDQLTAAFISDLQDHIEAVTTFYVTTDEVAEIIIGMVRDGHEVLPIIKETR